jgi:hypothetical protein
MFVGSISPSRNLETAQPGRYVFISERGAPMSAVAFRRMVTRLGPAAAVLSESSTRVINLVTC